jgi:coenzyme F420 hydrogenase subunit beta
LARVNDLETLVAYGLCAGCGLCESLAGRQCVEMAITSFGQIRPQVKNRLDDDSLGDILKVCPGATVTGPSRRQAGPEGRMHGVWGPIASLHRGWAADDAVRHRAAAGGALTALGCFLIESGKVDAILHVRTSATEPMLTDAQVSTTAQDVISGARSRYGPAAPLRHVHRLLDEGKTFAVIAKPCDVAAIRSLARIDPRVERQIPYCLSIFCGGVPSLHTANKIAAFHGVAPEEVSLFQWRGDGWPGTTHVETRDGRAFDLTYDTTWYDGSVPWTYDMQFRCKICPDAIGELSDVACPDGWVIEGGRPVHKEAPGVNVLVARTPKGANLVEAAAAAGAIALAAFEESEFKPMHSDHRPRKTSWPARILGLMATGQPRLRVRRYRRAAAIVEAGLRHTWSAFRGTVLRVRRGANREPLR